MQPTSFPPGSPCDSGNDHWIEIPVDSSDCIKHLKKDECSFSRMHDTVPNLFIGLSTGTSLYQISLGSCCQPTHTVLDVDQFEASSMVEKKGKILSFIRLYTDIHRKVLQRMQSMSIENSEIAPTFPDSQMQMAPFVLVQLLILYKALQMFFTRFCLTDAGFHEVAERIVGSIRVLPQTSHEEFKFATKFKSKTDSSRRDVLILALKKVGVYFGDHKLARRMLDDWMLASPGDLASQVEFA